jgi:mannitol-specific phosphotransferase system IIBC component
MELTVGALALVVAVLVISFGVFVTVLKSKTNKEKQNYEKLDLRVRSIEQYITKKKKRSRRASTKNKSVRRVDNM